MCSGSVPQEFPPLPSITLLSLSTGPPPSTHRHTCVSPHTSTASCWGLCHQDAGRAGCALTQVSRPHFCPLSSGSFWSRGPSLSCYQTARIEVSSDPPLHQTYGQSDALTHLSICPTVQRARWSLPSSTPHSLNFLSTAAAHLSSPLTHGCPSVPCTVSFASPTCGVLGLCLLPCVLSLPE